MRAAGFSMRGPWHPGLLVALCLAPAPVRAEASVPAPAAGTVAVLPARVTGAGDQAEETGTLLTGTLVARLKPVGGFDVVSAEEVAAVMRTEAQRQGFGADDPAVLADVAGALGARVLVVSDVNAAGTTLSWSASLVDAGSGQVLRRATVQGRDVAGLAAQVDELVLRLAGREREAELRGSRAARRLGFTSAADLEAFRAFRQRRPDATTAESLTEFIVERNVESDALAVAQASLFCLASATAAVACAAVPFSLVPMFNFQLAWVALGVLLGGALLAPLSAALGVAGMALVVVDALDLRRVRVRASGCCRNDADIHDAERRDGVRKAAALAVLASGPLLLFAPYALSAMHALGQVALVGAGVGYLRADASREYKNAPVMSANNILYNAGYFLAALLVCGGFLAVTPVGLVLLAWPERSAVDPAARQGEP